MSHVEVQFRGRWRFARVVETLADGRRRVRLARDGRELVVAPGDVRIINFVVKG